MPLPRFVRRREPVMVLEPMRFLGRSYEEGGILDRRRTRMRSGHLLRLIRAGKMALCRDLPEDKLWKHGYVYDDSIGRYPLHTKEEYEKLKLGKSMREDPTKFTLQDKGDGVQTIFTHSGVFGTLERDIEGKYDLIVNNQIMNDSPLTLTKMKKFIKEKLEELNEESI